MSNLLSEGQWIISAASVRGKGHVDGSIPNQDYVCVQTGANGDIVAAVVSDGAGSATHSAIGSKKTAEFMSNWLLQIGEQVISGAISHNQVRDRILEGIVKLRSELGANAFSLKELHCTLVGCLIMPDGGLICQIGDSIALASKFAIVNSADKIVDYFPFGTTTKYEVERGEYSNETHFVTESDWHQHLRVAPLPDQFDAVVMMTDGAMDIATLNGKVFRGFLSNMLGRLFVIESIEDRQKLITDWLSDPQTYSVTADDKTLFVALRKAAASFAKLSPLVDDELPSLPRKLSSKTLQPNIKDTNEVCVPTVSESKTIRTSKINLYILGILVALISFTVVFFIPSFMGREKTTAVKQTNKIPKSSSQSSPPMASTSSTVSEKSKADEKAEIEITPEATDGVYKLRKGQSKEVLLSLKSSEWVKLVVEKPSVDNSLKVGISNNSCVSDGILNSDRKSCTLSVEAIDGQVAGSRNLVVSIYNAKGTLIKALVVPFFVENSIGHVKSHQSTKSMSAVAKSSAISKSSTAATP